MTADTVLLADPQGPLRSAGSATRIGILVAKRSPVAMDIEVVQFRRTLRARLLAARQAPTTAEYAVWSAQISERLTGLLADLRPRLLGFYWPHRGEYDPMPVIAPRVAGGGQAALPVVVGRDRPLEYRLWSPGIAMTRGALAFGIPHPSEGVPQIPDILLIPLLGFDPQGYRLGYGGGYFDRTLAAWRPSPRTVGVGFEIGRVETIRPQPHDVAMDFIVSEQGVFVRP